MVLLSLAPCLVHAQKSQDLDHFWQPPEGKRYRVSSYNREGYNGDNVILEAGGRRELCHFNGFSGIIQRIWFTIDSKDPEYLQKIKIRMTFDGERTVDDIPVGMFTGTGPWRVNDISTPLINVMRSRRLNKDQAGVGAGSFNIHFPMPYKREAKIELFNGSSSEIKLFFYIDYLEKSLQEEPLLFHATHNIRSLTEPVNTKKTVHTKANHPFLKVTGYEGRYAGTILCVESHPDREGKWYEGDDMFIIDDEPWPPRLHGTGTEDYFGMAWGFHRPYQAFDHGIAHYQKDLTDHDRFFDGRYVTYRFHINDPVLFYKSLDASIEAGHGNSCKQHYESVAFWYGKRVPGAFLTEIGVCTGLSNAGTLAPHGYSYIEESVGGFLMPARSEEEFRKKLQQAQNAALPVKACNNFIPGSLKSTGPEAVHPEILEYMETAFRRAGEAGVKYIVFGSGASRSVPEGFSRDAALRQFIALCKKMAPIAEKYDVTVVLEPLNSKECNFINSVSEGGQIVEEVDHPHFRLLADIFHMRVDNEGPESLEKYGHLIYHTHIAEKEGRAAPGTHGEDFSPYFRALKNAGYTGRMSIECRWNYLEAQSPTAIKAIKNQLFSVK